MGDLDALRDALDRLRTLPARTAQAMQEEAELIKEESMANCPVAPDGGTLKASHEVIGPDVNGDEWVVKIQVGGAAEAYAMAVHEHLSEHSPYSWVKTEADGDPVKWNVGGPKFLENAARAAIPGFGERVAARVQAAS